MKEHPHLHCIMPAGGLSFDNKHWVHSNKKNNFFVHYKVLSNMFRGKYLALLNKAYKKGELSLSGKLRILTNNKTFSNFTWKLKQISWVVNIQKPFGSPKKVLEYLSRYVFRIAITDRRIIEVKNGKVLFSWKDYRTGTFKKMRLVIDEFIRRFLLHLLPQGFFKVRYHGIFSNRYRKQNIATAKKLLKHQQEALKQEAFEDGSPFFEKQNTVWDEIHKLINEFKNPNCPQCKKGRLRFAGIVPRE